MLPSSPGPGGSTSNWKSVRSSGNPAATFSATSAPDHIAGDAIFCDWSARDLQVNELPMGSGPAKSKDGAITLGPLLVTPDEIKPAAPAKSSRCR